MKLKKDFKHQLIFICFIIIIAVISQVIIFDNILIDVYSWHLVQPETVEGGLVLLILLMCYFLINRVVRTKYSFYLVILFTSIYIININLFVPLIFVIFYFEIIISIGRFINRKVKIQTDEESFIFYLKNFLIGFTMWSLVNLLLSLIGLGTINIIRVVTIVLFIISISKGIKKPFIWFFIEKLKLSSKKEKDLLSILGVLILALLSKSNRAIDYDSIWYGLRPEYVLVGDNSFFDNLGLVQFVHFYPKLFEFFTLPLSDLRDNSFIYTINIIFFVLSLFIIYLLIESFRKNSFYSLLGTLMIATIPAFANISATAKPDIFSIFFTLFGIYLLWIFIKTGDKKELVFGFASLLLTFGGKSTSFLYTPFIVIGFFVMIVYLSKKHYWQLNLLGNFRKGCSSYWLLLGSITVLLLTIYRTYKLTGYPVYPAGIGLWNKLGFEPKYPITSEHNVDGLSINFSIQGLLERWYKLLLDPKDFPHIIMLWTGNSVAFLLIIILLLILFNQFKINKFYTSSLFIFCSPVILIGIFFASFMLNGGDGNYFLIPIILAFVCFYTLLINNIKIDSIRIWVLRGLLLFLPIQILTSFVSHSSWSWGTQEYSTNLKIYQIESNENFFEINGLKEIAKYIEDIPSKTRAIGFGQEQILNRLPTRYENITGIASPHLGNSNIISSEYNFRRYLEWSKVDFIILPKEKIDGFEYVKNVISKFNDDPTVIKIEARDYILMDIRRDKKIGNTLDTAILEEGWYEKEENFRWINKKSTAIFQSGDRGKIIIEGIVPERFKQINLSIFVNGNILVNEAIKQGEFQIEKAIPKNDLLKIEIRADKSFVPNKEGMSNDVRELSIIVKNIETN